MTTVAGAGIMGAGITGGGPPAFHVLAKPTGPICNLDCEYCFFLSKEMLYPGDRFRMADEMLETYLRQLLEAHRTPDVTVAWQGGEPTMMGLDFFRRSVELVDQLKQPHQRIEYTIQTNGVLLDEDWAEFFKQNDVLVGLSVDGPRELHDRYRVDKRGLGSFDRVMAGYEHLKAAEVDVNVLCTVHTGNQDHALDVYRFFRDEMGVRYIQFIPIVERATETMLPLANIGWKTGDKKTEKRPLYVLEGNHVTDRSVVPEAFGRFLATIFDDWARNDVGEVYVQHFDTALANWYGEAPGVCVFSETCGAAVALEHNGDVYSCDHFVEPDYLLGNIAETPLGELVRSERQIKFGLDKRDTLPEFCRSCEVRFACHGGCPKNRFTETPSGEAGLNYLCGGYKIFFNHIDESMRIMCDLLREGRAPSDLPSVLASREAARYAGVGRNDTCPCGSGDKFKNCHGAISDNATSG
ncbi:MAG: anaerobic sulfatase maturase [Acidimicrobiia bacterium]|nr:anaerobic sulfatase maturase [Acidimicrobiia bacterium]